MSPDITAERKQHLEVEMKMHLEDAITQRRIWSNFVRDYVRRADPNLKLPDNAFPVLLEEDAPDYSDPNAHWLQDDRTDVDDTETQADKDSTQSLQYLSSDCKEELPGLNNLLDCVAEDKGANMKRGILLQAEDYGGGIALPHHGFKRPATATISRLF